MIPVALNVVQLELDRCGRPLAASASGAEYLALSAQQDDAPGDRPDGGTTPFKGGKLSGAARSPGNLLIVGRYRGGGNSAVVDSKDR